MCPSPWRRIKEFGGASGMRLLRQVISMLREVLGEEDYARYCRHLQEKHPGVPYPGKEEFYLDRLRERYARPTRCC
jgi:uncharacterized short protein YbdD (DUF466 family)